MKVNPASVFVIKSDGNKSKLRHISDGLPGISRQKEDDLFSYFYPSGEIVTDIDELNRIKSLAIPPAWQNVWISPYKNSHLQATGIDAKGRKQYRYHTEWNKKRSETKFGKLTSFIKLLPKLRNEIEGHLKIPGVKREKVIAAVVDLMSKAYIRIGNSSYTKEYGSYGLTTLRDKHVKINGDTIKIEFRGKKGVMQEITLRDRRLAKIIKSCRDIPGHELFQFYDDEGNRHVIDSGDINDYLHEVCGQEFSAKDFRTWAGTLHAFKVLSALPVPESEKEFRVKTAEVVKEVSKVLGNTPAVCRKYYIHPILFESFGSGMLFDFIKKQLSDLNIEAELEHESILLAYLENIEG
jgi:DNA topoisomerase I